MYILTPYTRANTVRALYGFRVALADTECVGRQKVSYSAVWCCMYILTPYTRVTVVQAS